MESALAFLDVEGAFFDAFFYMRNIKETKGVRLLYTQTGPIFSRTLQRLLVLENYKLKTIFFDITNCRSNSRIMC